MSVYESVALALERARAVGKTFHLAMSCKQIDAALICADTSQAKRVRDEYNLSTFTIDDEFRGSRGPFLIDNHAVSALCFRADSEINTLKEKLEKAKLSLRRACEYDCYPAKPCEFCVTLKEIE